MDGSNHVENTSSQRGQTIPFLSLCHAGGIVPHVRAFGCALEGRKSSCPPAIRQPSSDSSSSRKSACVLHAIHLAHCPAFCHPEFHNSPRGRGAKPLPEKTRAKDSAGTDAFLHVNQAHLRQVAPFPLRHSECPIPIVGVRPENCAMNILASAGASSATPGFCQELLFAHSTSAFSPYYLFLGGLCAVPLGDLSVTSPSGPCGEHPFHPRKQGISRKKHLSFQSNNPALLPPLRRLIEGPSPILFILLILSKLAPAGSVDPSTFLLLTLITRPQAASEARPHYIQRISWLKISDYKSLPCAPDSARLPGHRSIPVADVLHPPLFRGSLTFQRLTSNRRPQAASPQSLIFNLYPLTNSSLICRIIVNLCSSKTCTAKIRIFSMLLTFQHLRCIPRPLGASEPRLFELSTRFLNSNSEIEIDGFPLVRANRHCGTPLEPRPYLRHNTCSQIE